MLQQSRQDKTKVVIRVRPLANKQSDEIQMYEQFLEGRKKNNRAKLTPQSISFFSKYRNANPRQVVKTQSSSVFVYDQEYKNSQKKIREYNFSEVYGEGVSNTQIFDRTVREGIVGVLEGYNCTLMAYGITGSGKTFSIFGHPRIEKDRGLCFLAYEYLLSQKVQLEREGASVDIKFSFLEIYNENIRDLLSEDPKRQVTLSEDSRGNIQLVDACEVPIKSIEQITQLISSGSGRRASAATISNQVSSRSHAILKVSVEVSREKMRTSSKLFIIDLAGSQKLNNQNSIRKNEGVNINKSLLTLGNCISGLSQSTKKTGHIPFRDSKLTRLLKDSLSGNTRIIMIGCISPSPFTLQETVTTLNYAQKAQGIRKQVVRNIVNEQLQCPKCHFQMNSPNKQFGNFSLQMQSNSHNPHLAEIQNISNELLERLYNDIIDNARELQKLERLKSIMHQSCEELQVVFQANQTQQNILKETLINLFQHRVTPIPHKVDQQEDASSKPQKKRIKLLNSSRKNSKDKLRQTDKQNTINGTKGKDDLQQKVQSAVCSNFIPETQKQSQSKVKVQEQPEKLSATSLRRKRSKVEIIKKPAPNDPKRSCSQRAVTQY